MKTLSTILNKEFDFTFSHLGLRLDENLWSHDKWNVTIEGQDFEYNTGIGHRIEKDRFKRDEFKKVFGKNPKKEKQNLLIYNKEIEGCSKVKPLNIDDVLYSLISDAQYGEMLFSDFCDELGYNEDSVKHNEIYKSCQQNIKKIRTFISDLQTASKLFSEY